MNDLDIIICNNYRQSRINYVIRIRDQTLSIYYRPFKLFLNMILLYVNHMLFKITSMI